MNFAFFQATWFESNHPLEHQELKQFVTLWCFEDMIRVFYTNLWIIDDGIPYSKVNQKRIIVGLPDWLALTKLKFKGLKVNVAKALWWSKLQLWYGISSHYGQGMQGLNVKIVGSLSVDDTSWVYDEVIILNCCMKTFSCYGKSK